MKLSCNEIYDALIDMGLSEEQIKIEIKKKENDYQGYISKEGCLFLIAKCVKLFYFTVSQAVGERKEVI